VWPLLVLRLLYALWNPRNFNLRAHCLGFDCSCCRRFRRNIWRVGRLYGALPESENPDSGNSRLVHQIDPRPSLCNDWNVVRIPVSAGPARRGNRRRILGSYRRLCSWSGSCKGFCSKKEISPDVSYPIDFINLARIVAQLMIRRTSL